MTTAMIEVSSGNVIWRNFCHGVTPSIAAASYRAGEIDCHPANKVIATKGMPSQMVLAITENLELQGDPGKLIEWAVSPRSHTETGGAAWRSKGWKYG